MSVLYFVNSGCDDSHLKMNVEVFTLLREAKKYYNELNHGYSNQCKELVRCEFDKFEMICNKILIKNY
jgi:hypothetical protein